MQEHEVIQAIRLWAGRVLCDDEGLDQGRAMEIIIEHEHEITEVMREAVRDWRAGWHVADDNENEG
ncbi:hypothetical protein [Tautonia plasticadhaerens]|uniref:hypothetical protein n=1 Tax=Tautonia plasticadhaerens TaxID=2527974 RepID=UPI0011A4CB66|nr:hypothetical protein [Tautonia plasticadhaerens]